MPTGEGGSVCPTGKGELCAQEYLSKSVAQIRHSPADDALLCPLSPGEKNPDSPPLSSLPSQAPARVICFCSSNATNNAQAWSLAVPLTRIPFPQIVRLVRRLHHLILKFQPNHLLLSLRKPFLNYQYIQGSLSRHSWWHPLVTISLPQHLFC